MVKMEFVYLCFFVLFSYSALMYILNRITKVNIMQHKILRNCADYNLRHMDDTNYSCSFDWFYDQGPRYYKMIYSLKKIEIESWYNQMLINKLNK